MFPLLVCINTDMNLEAEEQEQTTCRRPFIDCVMSNNTFRLMITFRVQLEGAYKWMMFPLSLCRAQNQTSISGVGCTEISRTIGVLKGNCGRTGRLSDENKTV